MTQIITFKGCRFFGRRSPKNRTWARTKAGLGSAITLWRWGLKKTGKPMPNVFWIKTQNGKTNNLQSQSHSGGPPHVFFAKWVNKMRFQVFTLPIYSFIGHLNQILATSSSKGKLLVRTKVFGDHVNFGETKGEDYTILYIYWLVGSTHLPNWRHSNYKSQSKQI